jgi:RNA recognition motif. (a.k.a. RRM, RBD, or RNP domain)
VAVGVIEHSIPSSDLQEWFTPFGTVQSGQVITGRETGDSKGSALSRWTPTPRLRQRSRDLTTTNTRDGDSR